MFVVLDEMNLARVEYYFSDVLSCDRDRRGASTSLEQCAASKGTPAPAFAAELPLPANLYITGTVNVDETTNPVSDKVLDRAVVIDMSMVDLAGFLAARGARAGLADARRVRSLSLWRCMR